MSVAVTCHRISPLLQYHLRIEQVRARNGYCIAWLQAFSDLHLVKTLKTGCHRLWPETISAGLNIHVTSTAVADYGIRRDGYRFLRGVGEENLCLLARL